MIYFPILSFLVTFKVAIPFLSVFILYVLPMNLKVTFLYLRIFPLLFSSFAVNLMVFPFLTAIFLVTIVDLTVTLSETSNPLYDAFIVYFPDFDVILYVAYPLESVFTCLVLPESWIFTGTPTGFSATIIHCYGFVFA